MAESVKQAILILLPPVSFLGLRTISRNFSDFAENPKRMNKTMPIFNFKPAVEYLTDENSGRTQNTIVKMESTAQTRLLRWPTGAPHQERFPTDLARLDSTSGSTADRRTIASLQQLKTFHYIFHCQRNTRT